MTSLELGALQNRLDEITALVRARSLALAMLEEADLRLAEWLAVCPTDWPGPEETE